MTVSSQTVGVNINDEERVMRLGVKSEAIEEFAQANNYKMEFFHNTSNGIYTIEVTFPNAKIDYFFKNGICVGQDIKTKDECAAGKFLLDMYSFVVDFNFTYSNKGLWNGYYLNELVNVEYVLPRKNGLFEFIYLYSKLLQDGQN